MHYRRHASNVGWTSTGKSWGGHNHRERRKQYWAQPQVREAHGCQPGSNQSHNIARCCRGCPHSSTSVQAGEQARIGSTMWAAMYRQAALGEKPGGPTKRTQVWHTKTRKLESRIGKTNVQTPRGCTLRLLQNDLPPAARAALTAAGAPPAAVAAAAAAVVVSPALPITEAVAC